MNIRIATEQYLDYCKNTKKLEALTIKAYYIDFNQFIKMTEHNYGSIEINNISKKHINSYIHEISPRYSPKSLKRKVASLKALFRYYECEDIIDASPFRKIICYIKEPKRLPKSLSLFEIRDLIVFLYQKDKSESHVYLRNIAIFEIMFATGIRVSELCNLHLCDFDKDNQALRLIGKGNKERIIIINNSDVLQAISNYLTIRPNSITSSFLINRNGNRLSEQSVRYFIEDIGMKVLKKHITPHMIRHSFATLMLEEGVDIRYIQTILGHSSITTTQIYTHSLVAKQKQIMLAFHPRNRIHVLE